MASAGGSDPDDVGLGLVESGNRLDPRAADRDASPVDLDVTGIPLIAVEPASLNFGNVYLTQSNTLELTVSNPGTQTLEVSGITSDDPDDPVVDVPLSGTGTEIPTGGGEVVFEDEALTPNALIRALLEAPVDLLWNGGIGTYVKASTETNADAGDRSNDAVRINGRDLRCRVVGEGGNLGFTQRGRIEYALNDGRMNTDFIDNSADELLLLQLEAYYRDILPRGKLLRQVSEGIYFSDPQLWHRYRDANERVQLRYLPLNPDQRIPDEEITVTEEEISARYDEIMEEFAIPARATGLEAFMYA